MGNTLIQDCLRVIQNIITKIELFEDKGSKNSFQKSRSRVVYCQSPLFDFKHVNKGWHSIHKIPF